MNGPLLSVVIPVRNDLEGLQKTAESLRSFQQIEIVVVDGSDEPVADSDIFAFWDLCISGARSGVYDAMNRGVQQAHGTWVLFLGAGDTLEPQILRHIIEDLKTSDRASIHLFPVHMGSDREPGVPEIRLPVWSEELIWRNTVHHQGTFAPRNLLLQKPFDPRFKVLADYHWILQAFLNGSQAIVHEGSPIAMAASGGLSRQFTPQLYREEWALKRELLSGKWQLLAMPFVLLGKWGFKRWARLRAR